MRATKTCPWCDEPIEEDDETADVLDVTVHQDCERDNRCRNCDATGQVNVCRDENGEVDYVRGRPTGELAACDSCHGEGYRL